MRRVLSLLTAGLIAGLTGCNLTTGVCDCGTPTNQVGPIHPVPAGKPVPPGGPVVPGTVVPGTVVPSGPAVPMTPGTATSEVPVREMPRAIDQH
jgi:hypothetical protein